VEELPSLTTDTVFNEEPITQARSSYSPSPSEVEESPSLTIDTIFNEEPITQARETSENKVVVFSPVFNTIKNVFSPFEYVHRSE
jgi:hypothetical protein